MMAWMYFQQKTNRKISEKRTELLQCQLLRKIAYGGDNQIDTIPKNRIPNKTKKSPIPTITDTKAMRSVCAISDVCFAMLAPLQQLRNSILFFALLFYHGGSMHFDFIRDTG